MAGYTRQSSYTDGDVINAADSNDEFNQVVNVFGTSTMVQRQKDQLLVLLEIPV